MGDRSSGRIIFVPLEIVSYVFRGGAMEAGLIRRSEPTRDLFLPDRIYVRTIKGGTFEALDRNMSELNRRVDEVLDPIHQSILIHDAAVFDAYMLPDEMRVGVRAAPGLDYLKVSRRHIKDTRRRLLGPQKEEPPPPNPPQDEPNAAESRSSVEADAESEAPSRIDDPLPQEPRPQS